MTGNEAKVNSIDRVVDANLNISEFEHRPNKIRQWFSNNIIRPAFAYLVGWTGTKAVMLKATAAGVLKIADVGSGLERIDTRVGTAGIVESGDIVFDTIASRIRVVANNHDMYIRTSRDGTNFEDQIHIKADVEQTFDVVCSSFRVQRYSINDVDYELEGYR